MIDAPFPGSPNDTPVQSSVPAIPWNTPFDGALTKLCADVEALREEVKAQRLLIDELYERGGGSAWRL